MKLKYIGVLLLSLSFVGVYIWGYRTASNWETEIVTLDENALEANAADESIVKKSTRYYLETYNNSTEEEVVAEYDAPIEFIGLSREKLVDYIQNNFEYFTGQDEMVTNVMLVSFSEDKIVIRKNVDIIEETDTYNVNIDTEYPNYYIYLIDNRVVVYKNDMQTIYMETGISADELDEETQAELRVGVAVKNVSQLYRLLESYTS